MRVEKQGYHLYSPNEYPILVFLLKQLIEYPKLKNLLQDSLKYSIIRIYLPFIVNSKYTNYKKSYLFSKNKQTKLLLRKQKKFFYNMENLAIHNIFKGTCCNHDQIKLRMLILETHCQALS